MVWALAPVLFLATGCLKTRSTAKDSEQRQVLQQQVSTLQRETSDSSNRFTDVNEQIRDLRGRVEVVENRMSSGGTEIERTRQSLSEQNQGTERKLALLQETISKMDAHNQSLTAEVFALKAEVAALKVGQSAAAASASASAATKNSFSVAKDHFDKKEWKRAVLAFQKYRDTNPKGKNVAEATYLMGVSFQELKMKDEAKSFFDEVIANHPKSNEAKKARTRLKSLK
ncbi:MAG: tetratricopeptide repeat protein [Bdellovibrionaceae bacterium]|nr:tetratricopeptide repeat protein [Pseudobdellovibrionaceae bacterium]